MRFSSAFFAATVVLPVFGAPTLVPIIKRGGALKENSYIITLKDGVSIPDFVEALIKGFTRPDSMVVHTYSVIPGFSATIAPSDITLVRGMPGIELIETDQILSLPEHEGFSDLSSIGGSQLTSRANENTHDDKDGEGVVIYGIDTGIYIEHECFEGRASWGWSAYANKTDGHGHGTHTAATAICKKYGVATKAHIVAVKVMGPGGTGSATDMIKGIDYACGEYEKHKKPTVVSMPLNTRPNDALDKAVRNCIAKGVHFAVSAGNNNMDANGQSPARVVEANTIGSVDSNNTKASSSNFGAVVDVYAPGVNIVSAGIAGPKSEKTASGTSMATAYAAGILAVALSNHGQMSPPDLSRQLKEYSQNVCTGMPNGTTNALATRW